MIDDDLREALAENLDMRTAILKEDFAAIFRKERADLDELARKLKIDDETNKANERECDLKKKALNQIKLNSFLLGVGSAAVTSFTILKYFSII